MNGPSRFRIRRLYTSFRNYSQTVLQETTEEQRIKMKNVLELDPQVDTAITNGLFHPKKHPGISRKKADELPEKIVNAMEVLTEKQKKSQILQQANEMRGRLWGRLMPPEKEDYLLKIRQEKLKVKAVVQEVDSTIDDEKADKILEKSVTRQLKNMIHPWHPLGVTEETCLQYFVSRTSAEYCVLHNIFSDLQRSYPEFTPHTFFDFGSGVGSGHWAVNDVWKNSLKEVYNVDANLNMNNMATKILEMTKSKFSPQEGIYFRQFLPVSTDRKYDITLSAFTLLELPSFKDRMEAVSALWSKTENYLILVEDGTNAGYQAVIEARNLITHIESTEDSKQGGVHVVAPCMHELVCPRFTQDNTPCNFEITYLPPRFLDSKQERMKHLYSYVVLKKGVRPSEDSQWPRCVRPTLVRGKHMHFRLCTSEGKLEDVLIQKAYNCSNAYKCAKHTQWGDRLPGKINQYELSTFRINKKKI